MNSALRPTLRETDRVRQQANLVVDKSVQKRTPQTDVKTVVGPIVCAVKHAAQRRIASCVER